MTIFKQFTRALPGAILVATLCSAAASAALPENIFACQVETQGKGIGPGLVTVQAHTMKDARKLALQFDALTRNGSRAAPKALVECIEAPDGRFKDPMFQQFYENLER